LPLKWFSKKKSAVAPRAWLTGDVFVWVGPVKKITGMLVAVGS